MSHDVVRFKGGPLDGQTLGIAGWPPPETLAHDGGIYERVRMSAITDEQLAEMSFIARGAEYEWKVWTR